VQPGSPSAQPVELAFRHCPAPQQPCPPKVQGALSGTQASQLQVPGVAQEPVLPLGSTQLSVEQHCDWTVQLEPSVAQLLQVLPLLSQVSPRQQLAGLPQPWSR